MTEAQQLTNFQKVKEFNDSFNTERISTLTKNTFTEKKELITLLLSLIQEEEKEHARRSRGHKKQKELDEFFERLFSHLSVRERLRIVVILLLALLVFQIALFLGQNLLKDTLLP